MTTKFYLVVLSLLLFSPMSSFAEGTKEVSPSEANLTGLTSLPSQLSGSYLNCPADNRIYFRIKDFNTERFYFGLRGHQWSSDAPATNFWVRILNPSGTQVFIQRLNQTAGQPGFINTYAQAVAGPNIAGLVPAGYSPLSYTPTVNGDFWIEIYRSDAADGSTMLSDAAQAWIKCPYFDFTVATTTNTRYPGRVHCVKWNLVAISNATGVAGNTNVGVNFAPSGLASSAAQFFSYSTDSVVMKTSFQTGFRPIAYSFGVNNFGVSNTGNWVVDRASINSASAPNLSNGYKVFFNDPDITIYPSGTIPASPTFAEPTIRGCPPTGPYKLSYKLPENADVVLLFDINGTPGYQPATTDRIVEQPSRLAGLNTYTWDGKDGLGNQLASGTTFNFGVTTYFQKGRLNLPLYDAEINKGGINLSSIRPVATSNLRMFWDDSQLTNVGTCVTPVGNNNQEHNFTGAGLNNSIVGTLSPAHAWSGTGNTSQTIPAPSATTCGSALVNDVVGIPNATVANSNTYTWDDFGNVRVINTWAYGIDNFITKTLKLACTSISGTVYNDIDGSANGTFTNIQTGTENGTNGGTLYAAVIDPESNEVIAFAAVAADGTYTIDGVPINSTGLQVIITPTLPVVNALKPSAGAPAGGYDATTPTTRTFNTTETSVTGLDFGIQRAPETAVSTTVAGVNPGGTVNTTVTPSLFTTSNVGSNPNTQDYDGGTVTSIRFTAFPTNATSITIGATTYYPDAAAIPAGCTSCAVFPASGVTISAPGGVPSVPVTVDPNDGLVTVIIPFAAIDNAGKEDPTPGSVSLNYTSTLAIKFVSLQVRYSNGIAQISFVTAGNANGSVFYLEKGNTASSLQNSNISISGGGSSNYELTDLSPNANGKTFYRIKEVDINGIISYSEIRTLDLSVKGQINLYPTLVMESFTLHFTKENINKTAIIKIVDTKGQQIQNTTIAKTAIQENIKLKGDIANGIYLVVIYIDENEVANKKIVVVK